MVQAEKREVPAERNSRIGKNIPTAGVQKMIIETEKQ